MEQIKSTRFAPLFEMTGVPSKPLRSTVFHKDLAPLHDTVLGLAATEEAHHIDVAFVQQCGEKIDDLLIDNNGLAAVDGILENLDLVGRHPESMALQGIEHDHAGDFLADDKEINRVEDSQKGGGDQTCGTWPKTRDSIAGAGAPQSGELNANLSSEAW